MDFKSRVESVVEPMLHSIEEEMLDQDVKATLDYSPLLEEISNMEHAIKSEVVKIEKTVNQLLEDNNKEEKKEDPRKDAIKRKLKEFYDSIKDKMKEQTVDALKQIMKNIGGNTIDYLLPDSIDQLFLDKDYNDWGTSDIFEKWVENFIHEAPLWTHLIKEATKNNLQYVKIMNGIEKAQQLIQAGTSNIINTLDSMQSTLDHIVDQGSNLEDALETCCQYMHNKMGDLSDKIDDAKESIQDGISHVGNALDSSTDSVLDAISSCCSNTQQGIQNIQNSIDNVNHKSDTIMAQSQCNTDKIANELRRLPKRFNITGSSGNF